jgi:predicted flap endonuclease-1-like 5' DNA nuclease
MKLTRINAQHFGPFKKFELNRFSPGLNVIFGNQGRAKSLLRNMIRGILFGFDRVSGANSDSSSEQIGGSIEINQGNSQLRITRHMEMVNGNTAHLDNPIGFGQAVVEDFVGNNGNGHAYQTAFGNHFLADLKSHVTAHCYDAFFDVGFRDANRNVAKICQQMKSSLQVPVGNARWTNEPDYLQRKKEADERISKLATLNDEIESVRQEKLTVESELEHGRHYQSRLKELKAQIEEIDRSIRLSEARQSEVQAELGHIEREIDLLRVRIRELDQYVPNRETPDSIDELTAKLYRRLDKIDDQIRRWRKVQNDIQVQRLKLRDKMVAWSTSTINIGEYPFGEAQQKLTDLEKKILQVKNHADRWTQFVPAESDGNDLPWKVKSLCDQMNDDIYALCTELGTVQAYVQRRSAVVELKQLRRCFGELSDSLKRLIERRTSTLRELREIDPNGVAVIERAELDFCRCAEHEGYLTARQRYIGPFAETGFNEKPAYDSSELRIELDRLIHQQQSAADELGVMEQSCLELKSHRERLFAEFNGISSRVDEHDLLVKIDRLDTVMRSLVEERRCLQQQIEDDRRWLEIRPNHVLGDASKYFQRLSSGKWSHIWLDEATAMPEVSSAARSQVAFSNLDRTDQDVLALSLLLAAGGELAKRGIRLPIILDDLLLNMDREQVEVTLDVLEQFCSDNHQVILLSCAQQPKSVFAARSISTQELPDTSIIPRPFEPFKEEWRVASENSYARPNAESVAPSWDSFATTSKDARTSEWIGKSIESATPLSENATLESIGLTTFEDARQLQRAGIVTVGDLLNCDVEEQRYSSLATIGKIQLQTWQDQAHLMLSVPGLRVIDARVLTGCYIYTANRLDELSSEEVRAKIAQFMKSESGKHYGVIFSDYNVSRIDAWKRSMQRTRSQWSRKGSMDDRRVISNRSNRAWDQSDVTPMTADPKGQAVRIHRESLATDRGINDDTLLRFYLELSDSVEQAPSIGPKTAERLSKAGVVLVSDLLRKKAEEIVASLDYKRIKPDHVRDWQRQTELVCTVPNLRGHDAQILVACGIVSAKQLAGMDPKTVLGLVEPFLKTKEGMKLLRTNKRPDLAEVTDWINWAKHQRSVKAA